MGKIAFALGVVGSLVVGLLMSSRLEHRDYSASIVQKLGMHGTCPTFWVSWEKAPDLVPDGLVKCGCPEQAAVELNATPIHPPKEMHDAASPMDGMTMSYTSFTSPGGSKSVGLSYVLIRGMDKQSFVVSPAFGPYSKFATVTAIPLIVGVVLAVLLSFLPKKKGSAD